MTLELLINLVFAVFGIYLTIAVATKYVVINTERLWDRVLFILIFLTPILPDLTAVIRYFNS